LTVGFGGQPSGTDNDPVAWALNVLNSGAADGDVRVAETSAGREARVWRLEGGRPPRSYFLKQYAGDLDSPRFLSHVEYAARIARALTQGGRHAPEVLASSNELRAIVLSSVPGRALMALRAERLRSPGSIASLAEPWRGVGDWLHRLHHTTLPPEPAGDRRDDWGGYIELRLQRISRERPEWSALCARATAVVADLVATLPRSTLLHPCHGDVSIGNIIVSDTVALIDFDDARPDLPGLDVSQALLQIADFGRVAGLLPIPALARRCTEAFLSGYTGAQLNGAEFWVPHLRNVAVILLTWCQRLPASRGLDRSSVNAQCRRMHRHLASVVDALERDGSGAAYLRTARNKD
jgi:tRNA A-37 threonylcarbamoyl transferase component Bud32